MKTKKILAFLLCSIVILTLNDCSKVEDNNEVPNSSDISSGEISNSSEIDEKEESDELKILRSKIKESNCYVGIALVDYVSADLSEEDTVTYLNHSETAEQYSFINDIKTIAYNGSELFVFVPADVDSVITIFPVDITYDAEFEVKRDEIIYQGDLGEPVAVRCNVGEGYPNILVSVTNGNESNEFYPLVSLEDGWTIALEDGCYDFSIDNIHKYIDKIYYMLPKIYPDIQEAIDNGNGLVYAGDFYFCDQIMVRFELGKYSDSNGEYKFECEKQYAVSFDATYEMDPSNHKWYVIGSGINGM